LREQSFMGQIGFRRWIHGVLGQAHLGQGVTYSRVQLARHARCLRRCKIYKYDLWKGVSGDFCGFVGGHITRKEESKCAQSTNSEQGGSDCDPSSSSRINALDANPEYNEMGRVVRLALPALIVVISDPLQTLVDSACLGRYSTIHLAAIGPNTAVFNSVFQLFTFLGVTTANTVASNLQHAGEEGSLRDTRDTVGTAIILAICLGAMTTILLLTLGSTILHGMGTDAQVVPYALEYLNVRALGTPVVLVLNAFQGLCLGQQDTITPMMVCALVTALNIVGDIVLISYLGMGARGAATATVCAQAVGLLMMVYHTKKKAHISGVDYVDEMRWPDKSSCTRFVTVGSALIARTAAGMTAYFSMAMSAMGMGIAAAAAHQVAMQIFWFISYLPEPLSMAAQTLVAKEYGSHPQIARRWARMLVSWGGMFGIILSGIAASALIWGAQFFSSDMILQQTVQSLAPYGALAIAICSVLMMYDGISIGSSAFSHLPVGVAGGLFVVLGILYWGAPLGLPSVWWALCGFYATRLVVHLVYYGILSRPRNVFFAGESGTKTI